MRVFNISHHKCGTMSVFRALEILGFKSYHFHQFEQLLNAHLNGDVAGDPLLNEDNTAWSDMPIPLMYRSLYEAFPNETYIFVRRNPEAWVDSLRRHIEALWPIGFPMHTMVYGYQMKSTNFDVKVCLKVYRRICEDVLEFFEGKPNFHLIEFEQLSWKPLCAAVGKSEPEVPFPWENKWAPQV